MDKTSYSLIFIGCLFLIIAGALVNNSENVLSTPISNKIIYKGEPIIVESGEEKYVYVFRSSLHATVFGMVLKEAYAAEFVFYDTQVRGEEPLFFSVDLNEVFWMGDTYRLVGIGDGYLELS